MESKIGQTLSTHEATFEADTPAERYQKALLDVQSDEGDGDVLNDNYSKAEYITRRHDHLRRHQHYAGLPNLGRIARSTAEDVFGIDDRLSVQEGRRREKQQEVIPLLPFPTKSNRQSIDNFASYPAEEWKPSVAAPEAPAEGNQQQQQTASPAPAAPAPAERRSTRNAAQPTGGNPTASTNRTTNSEANQALAERVSRGEVRPKSRTVANLAHAIRLERLRERQAVRTRHPDFAPEWFDPDNFDKGEVDKGTVVRCVCGSKREKDEVKGEWVQCDGCDVWQHTGCVGEAAPKELTEDPYSCHMCDPYAHRAVLQELRRASP